jgi:hypothetical protein
LRMTIAEAHAEVKKGWASSYSPEAIEHAVNSLAHKPLGYRVNILIARLCFRGIYFPQMGPLAWWQVIKENRRVIFSLMKQGYRAWRGVPAAVVPDLSSDAGAIAPSIEQ